MTFPKGQTDLLIETYTNAANLMGKAALWLAEDGQIIAASTALAAQLGYPSDELKKKSIFEVNPHFNILKWRSLWEILKTKNSFKEETEQINSEGKIYPIIMRGISVQVEDQIFCFCLIENRMDSHRFEDLLNYTCSLAQIGTWEYNLIKEEFILAEELRRLFSVPIDRENLTKNDFLIVAKKILSKDDFQNLFELLKEIYKSGGSNELEFTLETPTGSEQKKLYAKAIKNEIGDTIKIVGLVQDISNIQSRTEEMYFKDFIIENAPYAIYWLDEDGNIIYANHTATKMLGYKRDEWKNIRQVNVTITDKDLNAILKNSKVVDTISYHTTKDGETIPVKILSTPISYKGKKYRGSYVRDFRNAIKKEEELQLAFSTVDNSNDLIIWFNADGTLRYFNKRFLEQTGYSVEEASDKYISDIFPGINMEKFKKGWKVTLKGNRLIEEHTLVKKDGTELPMEMSAVLIKIGENEYASGIFKDLSYQKEKEIADQRHRQEIEDLNFTLRNENVTLKEEIELEFNFGNIISTDKNYKKVLHQVAQVADTDATVLILGETGTGKELLARAVHSLSDRSDYPLIKVNCGALPENLIESELFGHEKGAFTGAHQQKIGKFERADKGTIFLDEIGEMPLEAQTKLLRVLQEGEIERVGGTKTLNVDVRVIAATNRNLEEQVAKGKFRSDLFYRLNVFPIENISLRERVDDIPVLTKYFVDKYSKKFGKTVKEIPVNFMRKLQIYDFPGNVRELENIIERAMILTSGNTLAFQQEMFRKSDMEAMPGSSNRFPTLDEAQAAHIIEALKRTKGRVSGKAGAAMILGINDRTLISRMKKLSINKNDYLT